MFTFMGDLYNGLLLKERIKSERFILRFTDDEGHDVRMGVTYTGNIDGIDVGEPAIFIAIYENEHHHIFTEVFPIPKSKGDLFRIFNNAVERQLKEDDNG